MLIAYQRGSCGNEFHHETRRAGWGIEIPPFDYDTLSAFSSFCFTQASHWVADSDRRQPTHINQGEK